MKALTVRQPFASWIVDGSKQVENRSTQTHVRGRIVIHAAKELHDRYVGVALEVGHAIEIARMPRSSILGTVQLVDCHNSETCARGACQRRLGAEYTIVEGATIWHWVLEDPREFVTPIPRVRGALGFWTPTDSDAYLVETAEVVS